MRSFIASACVVVILAAWWLWPRSVELTPSQYDVALALYRVCNQASQEGLADIEAILAQDAIDEDDGEDSPLQSIVDTAKRGDWKAAAKACRQLMHDQLVEVHSP